MPRENKALKIVRQKTDTAQQRLSLARNEVKAAEAVVSIIKAELDMLSAMARELSDAYERKPSRPKKNPADNKELASPN